LNVTNCEKKVLFIIEWDFFLCYNHLSRLHKPWCYIRYVGRWSQWWTGIWLF